MAKQTMKPDIEEELLVSAEEIKETDGSFDLDKLVEDGSEDNFGEGDIRYLRNDGKPNKIHVDLQRFVFWKDKDGREMMLEIVWGGRPEAGPEELFKARQLRLADDEKALLYSYQNGDVSKKILPVSHTFFVTDYPHVKNVVIGEASGIGAKKRRYTILCGQTAIITNIRDFQYLFKTFAMLNEVDKHGEIKRANVLFQPQPERPVVDTRPIPEVKVGLGISDMKIVHKEYYQGGANLIKEAEKGDMSLAKDEESSPSKEI